MKKLCLLLLLLIPVIALSGEMRERPIITNGFLRADNGTPLRGDMIYVIKDPYLEPSSWFTTTKFNNPSGSLLFNWYVDSLHLNALRLALYRYPVYSRDSGEVGYIPNVSRTAMVSNTNDRRRMYPNQQIMDLAHLVAVIDTFANRCERYGMYLMIDYHAVHGVDTLDWLRFWGTVAPRYANKKHVFYEALNEPNQSPMGDPAGFTTAYTGGWTLGATGTGIRWSPHQLRWQIGWQKRMWQRMKAWAPNTHIVMCSFSNGVWDQLPTMTTMVPTWLMVSDGWGPAIPFSPNGGTAVVGYHGYYAGSPEFPKSRDSVLLNSNQVFASIMTEHTLNIYSGTSPTWSQVYDDNPQATWAQMKAAIQGDIHGTSSNPRGLGWETGQHGYFIQTIARHANGTGFAGTATAPSKGRVMISENLVTWPKDPSTSVPGSEPPPSNNLTSIWAIDDSYRVPGHFVGSENDSAKRSLYRNGCYNFTRDSIFLYAARNEVVAFQVITEAATTTATGVEVRLDSIYRTGYTIKNALSQGVYNSDPLNTTGKNIQSWVEHYINIPSDRTAADYAWWSGARPGAEYDSVWRLSYVGALTRSDTLFTGFQPHILVPREASTVNKYGRPYKNGQGGMPFTVTAGRSQGVWFDVYIPKDAPAGLYRGTVKTYEGTTLVDTTKLTLYVYNFALSDTNHYVIHGALGDNYAIRHGVPQTGSSNTHWDMYKKYSTEMHKHRCDISNSGNMDYIYNNQFKSLFTGSWYSVDSAKYGGAPGLGIGNQVFWTGIYQESNTARREFSGEFDTLPPVSSTYGTNGNAIDRSRRMGTTGKGTWDAYYHLFNAENPAPATLKSSIKSIWTDSVAYRDSLYSWMKVWRQWADSINPSMNLGRYGNQEMGVLGGNPSQEVDKYPVTLQVGTDVDEAYVLTANAPTTFVNSVTKWTWLENTSRSNAKRHIIVDSVTGSYHKLRLSSAITGQAAGDIVRLYYIDDYNHYAFDTSGYPGARLIQRWFGSSPYKMNRAIHVWPNPFLKTLLTPGYTNYALLNLIQWNYRGWPTTWTNYPELRPNTQQVLNKDSIAAWKAYGWTLGTYGGTRPGGGVEAIDAPLIDERINMWMLKQYGMVSREYWILDNYYSNDLWNYPKSNGIWVVPGTETQAILDSNSRQINGPLPTMKLKNSRRGIQDLEYFYEAERRGINTAPYIARLGATGGDYSQSRPVPPYPRGFAQFGGILDAVRRDLGAAIEGTGSIPPVILSFTASVDTTDVGGGTVTLTWTTLDGSSASIDQGIGDVALNGSMDVEITVTTIWQLTVVSPYGTAKKSLRVIVPSTPGAQGSILASPDTLPQGGGEIQVTWSTEYADSVRFYFATGDSMMVDLAGSLVHKISVQEKIPQTQWIYKIKMFDSGAGATVMDTVTILPYRWYFRGFKR